MLMLGMYWIPVFEIWPEPEPNSLILVSHALYIPQTDTPMLANDTVKLLY